MSNHTEEQTMAKANVQRKLRKVNLEPKAAAKPAKGAAPAAKAADTAPRAKGAVHTLKGVTYSGPSPVVRGHSRKLTAINTNLGAGQITERDEAFIRGVRTTYGSAPFKRLDLDAGCVRRAISHQFITHVGGDLGSRDAIFKVTSKGMGYGAK
jgi:hypothetical protein